MTKIISLAGLLINIAQSVNVHKRDLNSQIQLVQKDLDPKEKELQDKVNTDKSTQFELDGWGLCLIALCIAVGIGLVVIILCCCGVFDGSSESPKKKKTNAKKNDKKHQGQLAEAASLGVIRLDYDYPPSPGDIDCPDSFGYDVHYRVVPGLTFEMCQSGKMTEDVEQEYVLAIKWLVKKGVDGITGDCGFMMYFQKLARQHTTLPVFMSSLAQLPAVSCAYSKDEQIIIMTANSKTLEPMRELIREECGVHTDDPRFFIYGGENIKGFEAVALGEKVDIEKVTPGMVKMAKQALKEHPDARAFLLECTELPPYSDAIREATGKPVFDSITCCDFFMSGVMDNERFGINDWQDSWDHEQSDYKFGKNLTKKQKNKLKNKAK